MSSNPMTREGKENLETELKRLKITERPKVIEEIAVARSHGDLSENAEYDAAREKQGFIEGRIADIEDKIARAVVIDPKEVKTDKVVFGAKVTLLDLDTDEKKVYYLVGADEADVKQGRLSVQTPIARALINKKVGDEVTVKVPKGDLEFEVLNIDYDY